MFNLVMNDIQKRFILFLVGCIGMRLFFVYAARNASSYLLPYLGYIAFLIAISFFYLFFTNSRTTGIEVFGDKIWWNNLRPIHGILYVLFAYSAINGNKDSWIYLLADVIIGLTNFILFHALSGNITIFCE
jgi:hypothetical protein